MPWTATPLWRAAASRALPKFESHVAFERATSFGLKSNPATERFHGIDRLVAPVREKFGARSTGTVVHATGVLWRETGVSHAGFVSKCPVHIVVRVILWVLELRLSDASRDGSVPLRAVLGRDLCCKTNDGNAYQQ